MAEAEARGEASRASALAQLDEIRSQIARDRERDCAEIAPLPHPPEATAAAAAPASEREPPLEAQLAQSRRELARSQQELAQSRRELAELEERAKELAEVRSIGIGPEYRCRSGV